MDPFKSCESRMIRTEILSSQNLKKNVSLNIILSIRFIEDGLIQGNNILLDPWNHWYGFYIARTHHANILSASRSSGRYDRNPTDHPNNTSPRSTRRAYCSGINTSRTTRTYPSPTRIPKSRKMAAGVGEHGIEAGISGKVRGVRDYKTT